MHVEAVTMNSHLRANCAHIVIHTIEAGVTFVCMQVATNLIASQVILMLMQKNSLHSTDVLQTL